MVKQLIKGLLKGTELQTTNKDDEIIIALHKDALKDIYKDIPEVGVFNLNNDPYVETELKDFLNRQWTKYGAVGRRGNLEENTEYKQIIPYTVIKQGDKYFTYTRLVGGGEQRLHGKSSIGVGGHANPVDYTFNFEHLFAINNSRELDEELYIKHKEHPIPNMNNYKLSLNSQWLGLIYNEKTEVDSVHLGILNVIELPETCEVTVQETDTLEGSFKTLDEIKELELENWTISALTVL